MIGLFVIGILIGILIIPIIALISYNDVDECEDHLKDVGNWIDETTFSVKEISSSIKELSLALKKENESLDRLIENLKKLKERE